MSLGICPAALVEASVERIWALLANVAGED
jgi:hypothetical protein